MQVDPIIESSTQKQDLKAAAAAQVFSKYDIDGDGVLSKEEFTTFVKEALGSYSDEQAAALLNVIDSDNSGTVGMCELQAFLRCYSPGASSVKTKSALIIIDVQNDFISGTLANPDHAETLVPKINGIRDYFDMVVISYDWHPFTHCSFVESANEGKVDLADDSPAKPEGGYPPFSMVKLAGDADRAAHEQALYPRHGVQDTWGAETHKDLVVKESDGKVFKGSKPNIDSYSAFFDNCKANDTGLTAMLEANGITHVYACGLVTDICVKSTALHGAEAGFVTAVRYVHCPCRMCHRTAGWKQAHLHPTSHPFVWRGQPSGRHSELSDLCSLELETECRASPPCDAKRRARTPSPKYPTDQ